MSADLVRLLYRLNGCIAFGSGLLANGVLVMLVLRARVRIDKYQRLILQMVVVDSIFLVCDGISDPMIVLMEGTEVVLQNGFLRKVPQPFNLLIICALCFSFYFTLSSLSVQFLFRYLILCNPFRHRSVSNGCLLAMLAVPFSLSMGMGVLAFPTFRHDRVEAEFATRLLKDFLLATGETSVFPGGVSRHDNVLLHVFALCAVLMVLGDYLIIAFCVTRIHRTLRRLAPMLQHRTRLLHTQLNRTLLVQAVAPVLVSVGPLAYLCYCIMWRQTAFLSLIAMMVCVSWLPFANATTTIVILRPLRRELWHVLRCPRRKPAEERGVVSRTTSSFLRIAVHRQTSSG